MPANDAVKLSAPLALLAVAPCSYDGLPAQPPQGLSAPQLTAGVHALNQGLAPLTNWTDNTYCIRRRWACTGN